MPDGTSAGKVHLYEDGRYPTSGGRGRFVPLDGGVTAEQGGPRHPLHLTTGRMHDRSHGLRCLGKLAQRVNQADKPRLSLRSDDVAWRGLADGAGALVTGRRGEVAAGAALEVLREERCCGTSWRSCLPAVKRMITRGPRGCLRAVRLSG